MSTRKEKVAKAQERRKQPAVKAEMVRDAVTAVHPQMVRDNTPIPAVKADGVREAVPATHPAMVKEPVPATHPAMVKEATPATHPEMVKEPVVATHPAMVKEPTPATHPTMVADYDIPKINPIVGKAVSDGTAPVAQQVVKKSPVPATHPEMVKDEESARVKTPATHPAMVRDYEPLPEVQNPLKQKDAGINIPSIDERIQQSLTEREAVNQTEEEKPLTISDLVAGRLEELREKAETEKTDAQKMQKYYALTDALKSLGKMGGAAIGGAIGGDMLGGAPTVGEYKESRGYLDAFEKAKQANDRLRSLDETEFKLAVEDAERSYNQQLAKIERDFKAEQAQIEREWQQYMVDYKSKIEQAYKVGNMALAHQYEMELAQKQGEIRDRQIAAQNKADMAEKQISLQIAQLQNDPNKKKTPIKFNDGTSVAIPDWLYEGLKENLIGSTVNGKTVKESNVTQIIKDNPELAKEFLSGFGFELSSQKAGETKVDDNWAASVVGKDKATFPMHISQVPAENMKVSPAQPAYSIETDPFAEFLE